MKFCSNCGEQIDEKAVICVKCGVPVGNSSISNIPNYDQSYNQGYNQGYDQSYNQNYQTTSVQKQGHGAATASLVLGIIGLIAGIITLCIAIGIYFYYRESTYDYGIYSYSYRTFDSAVKITVGIFLTFVPGVLSLIGLPLGAFCRKGGPKIAGIVLNAITLVICIIQVVLIVMA